MKLTEAQILRVQKFMDTEKLQYEEVKQELFDHLVSLIEEELDREPDRPFEEMIYAAYRSFGKGFSYIEADYEKQIEKQVTKSSWKFIYRQFIEPFYLLRSLVLFGLCYGIVHFGLSMPYLLYGFFVSLFITYLFYLSFLKKEYKKRYANFAQFKFAWANSTALSFLLFQLSYHFYISPLLFDNLVLSTHNEWVLSLVTWGQILLFVATFEQMTEVRKNISKQYLA